MFPYLIVFTVSIIVCFLYNDRRKWVIIIPCLLLSLLAGFRDKGIGTDTLLYIERYFSTAKQINNIVDIINIEQFDKGFLVLACISLWFDNNINYFYFLIELLILSFLFIGLIRLNKIYKNHKIILIFLYIWLFLQYNASYNAMRQMCAMSIMFFSLTYALENKWVSFIIWSFVAYLFHSTSIVSIIIPFLYIVSIIKDVKVRWIMTLLCIIVSIITVIGYSYILNYINMINILNKDFGAYDEGGKFEGIDRLAYSDLALVIIQVISVIICKIKKIINNQLFIFHILILIIYFSTLLIGFYNMYAARIGQYFFIISIVLWAIELSKRQILKSLFFYITMAIVFVWWLHKIVILNSHETIPYTSSILGL